MGYAYLCGSTTTRWDRLIPRARTVALPGLALPPPDGGGRGVGAVRGDKYTCRPAEVVDSAQGRVPLATDVSGNRARRLHESA